MRGAVGTKTTSIFCSVKISFNQSITISISVFRGSPLSLLRFELREISTYVV